MDSQSTPGAGGGSATAPSPGVSMSDFRKKYESFSTILPLFDLSFNSFITLSILKVLYVIFMLLWTLAALSLIMLGFSQGFMFGVGSLFLVPFLWLIWLIFTRMYLELIAVIFRIAHNTTMLVKQGEGSVPK